MTHRTKTSVTKYAILCIINQHRVVQALTILRRMRATPLFSSVARSTILQALREMRDNEQIGFHVADDGKTKEYYILAQGLLTIADFRRSLLTLQ